MMIVRRRLFWKVYLTLLFSLVTVAVLVGGFWWLMGESLREHRGALRVRLPDTIVSGRAGDKDAVSAAISRIADDVDADVTMFASDGAVVAASGEPIALSAIDSAAGRSSHILRIDLPDGRALVVRPWLPPRVPALRILTVVLVVTGGVGLAAFPMTARLTRQLEGLRLGVARWGAGMLSARVDDSGADEVALVARTFNAAAERVEFLVNAQKTLLANASHELRSPLARLRMAIELWLEKPVASAHAEIVRDLAEIDQLVEEILLASRLDYADTAHGRVEGVDLLGLAAEEAARVDAIVDGVPVEAYGDPTLLRRLIRNLLENAVQHGGRPIQVSVARTPEGARVVVCDAGQGIAAEERERVFEPFYRPHGHTEAGGGWGLGLSLVRQIAERHGGTVACEGATGGGSRFIVDIPVARATPSSQRARVPA